MDNAFSLNNSYSYGGESLLHVAAKNGHLSMLKLLLERGANINIQDESGNTALHYAASNGKKDVVKYLLDQHADVAIINTKEQKAIDYASIKGFNEIAALLLSYNSPNATAAPKVAESKTESSITNKKQALLDLKELLDAGVLSQTEFDDEKAKILRG